MIVGVSFFIGFFGYKNLKKENTIKIGSFYILEKILCIEIETMYEENIFYIEISNEPTFKNAFRVNKEVDENRRIFVDIKNNNDHYIRIKPKKNHVFYNWSDTFCLKDHEHNTYIDSQNPTALDPTCISTGICVEKCETCDFTQKKTQNTLPHNFKENKITPSSCTNHGSILWRCDSCGTQKITTLPIKEHQFHLAETIEPTCVAIGYDIFRCSVCSKEYRTEKEIVDHIYEITSQQKATCINDGYKIYTCNMCKDNYQEVISKKGHNHKEKEETINNSGDLVVIYECRACNDRYEIIKEKDYRSKYGYVSNLVVPEIGLNVRVHDSGKASTGIDAQGLCDKENSAAIQYNGGRMLIGDHCYQGFDKIYRCVPNQTIAYYDGKKYICAENMRNGINAEYYLADANGSNVSGHPGDFITFTCNSPSDWRSVTIVFWKRID